MTLRPTRMIALGLTAAGGAAVGSACAAYLFGFLFDRLWQFDLEWLLDHRAAPVIAMLALAAAGGWAGFRAARSAPSQGTTLLVAALAGTGAAALAYMAAEASSFDLGEALGLRGHSLKDFMISMALYGSLAGIGVGVLLALHAFGTHRGFRLLTRFGLATAAAIPLAVFIVASGSAIDRSRFTLGVDQVVRFELSLPGATHLDPATAKVQVETDRGVEQAWFYDQSFARQGERLMVQGSSWMKRPTSDRALVLSPSDEPNLRFRIELPAKPQSSESFGPWRQEVLGEDAWIRVRVVP